MVGVSAGLIPFLEHDDANRALMGSNMQRQAVPLLVAEPPIVATGLERPVAHELGHDRPGRSRTARSPTSTRRGSSSTTTDDLHAPQVRRPERADLPEPEADRQDRARRSRRAQILADGAATYKGELALGRNVLVAFMTWDGYNFEDAIIISERLVKEDIYTSIHIEEFEIEIRETKLGSEEFTRDIPNVSREGAAEPRRERHRPDRHLRQAGRHPGRQGRAEVQERADARGEAAARDLRPGRRGREERLAGGPVGRRGRSSSTPSGSAAG